MFVQFRASFSPIFPTRRVMPWICPPISLSSPSSNHHIFQSLRVCFCCDLLVPLLWLFIFHTGEKPPDKLSFSASLILLSINPSRSIHVVTKGKTPAWNSRVSTPTSLSRQPSTGGCAGCFHVFVIRRLPPTAGSTPAWLAQFGD